MFGVRIKFVACCSHLNKRPLSFSLSASRSEEPCDVQESEELPRSEAAATNSTSLDNEGEYKLSNFSAAKEILNKLLTLFANPFYKSGIVLLDENRK